eukprot:jgi/Chrzof1/5994/Cz17g00010.t1
MSTCHLEFPHTHRLETPSCTATSLSLVTTAQHSGRHPNVDTAMWREHADALWHVPLLTCQTAGSRQLLSVIGSTEKHAENDSWSARFGKDSC